jgi:hypothetical protein
VSPKGQLFDTDNAIVSGLGVVVLSAAGIVAQLLFGSRAPWLLTSAGSLALATGIILIVVAAATGSTASYRGGTVLAGAGFGSAYLGGLRALSIRLPAEHSAAVLSAFFVVAYAALSVPAILAGVAVSHITLESTFEISGSIVAAIGLFVALLAWRTRPAPPAEATERTETLRHVAECVDILRTPVVPTPPSA